MKTRLTVAMLEVIADALSEHEAGAWIALTQNLPGGEEGEEAERFVKNGQRVFEWVAQERERREKRKNK